MQNYPTETVETPYGTFEVMLHFERKRYSDVPSVVVLARSKGQQDFTVNGKEYPGMMTLRVHPNHLSSYFSELTDSAQEKLFEVLSPAANRLRESRSALRQALRAYETEGIALLKAELALAAERYSRQSQQLVTEISEARKAYELNGVRA